MKIWAISDTHGRHGELEIPDVDIVIHAGDFADSGTFHENAAECMAFFSWMESLKIPAKIVVPGNHDIYMERISMKRELAERGITLLLHDSATIAGHRMFGSPYTPTFGIGWSFNRNRSKIGENWEQIPENTDILITHGPPKGILDLSVDLDGELVQVGDISLYKRVLKIRPRLHIFGHIHSRNQIHNYGVFRPGETTFVNAAICRHQTDELNRGIVLDVI